MPATSSLVVKKNIFIFLTLRITGYFKGDFEKTCKKKKPHYINTLHKSKRVLSKHEHVPVLLLCWTSVAGRKESRALKLAANAFLIRPPLGSFWPSRRPLLVFLYNPNGILSFFFLSFPQNLSWAETNETWTFIVPSSCILKGQHWDFCVALRQAYVYLRRERIGENNGTGWTFRHI